MNTINKIIGIVLIGIGIIIWIIDYLVFSAIGAVGMWLAHAAGITGMAVLGVQLVGWILLCSFMVLLLALGLYVVVAGIGLLFE